MANGNQSLILGNAELRDRGDRTTNASLNKYTCIRRCTDKPWVKGSVWNPIMEGCQCSPFSSHSFLSFSHFILPFPRFTSIFFSVRLFCLLLSLIFLFVSQKFRVSILSCIVLLNFIPIKVPITISTETNFAFYSCTPTLIICFPFWLITRRLAEEKFLFSATIDFVSKCTAGAFWSMQRFLMDRFIGDLAYEIVYGICSV